MKYLSIVVLLFLASCNNNRDADIRDQIVSVDQRIEVRRAMLAVDSTFCDIHPTSDCLRHEAKEAQDISSLYLQKDSLLNLLGK